MTLGFLASLFIRAVVTSASSFVTDAGAEPPSFWKEQPIGLPGGERLIVRKEGEPVHPFNAVAGLTWNLVELSGHPVATPPHGERPFILFEGSTSHVSGYAGCNRFFGGYDLDGTTLKFGMMGATRRACPDLEGGLETEFFTVLDATRQWRIEEGVLQFLNDERVLARFKRKKEL